MFVNIANMAHMANEGQHHQLVMLVNMGQPHQLVTVAKIVNIVHLVDMGQSHQLMIFATIANVVHSWRTWGNITSLRWV